MALIDKLTNIAEAIRGKTGGTDLLTLDEMATAIASIQTGINAEEITIAMDASDASAVRNIFIAAMDASDVTTAFVYQGDIGGSTKNNQCLIIITSINFNKTEMLYARYRDNKWSAQSVAGAQYDLVVSAGDIYAKVVLQ